MPLVNNRWESKKKVRRPRSIRKTLILCEDTKSSRYYFERFPFDTNLAEVICVGTGMNTDSLMEEAIRRKNQAILARESFAEIWVVFDKDSFPLGQFNRAFQLANNHGDIIPCWSNECFEFWYLLHFEYRDTGLGRNDIFRELSKKMGQSYSKSSRKMYEILASRLNVAIKNAEKLASQKVDDHRDNPSTHVHALVKKLKKLAPGKFE